MKKGEQQKEKWQQRGGKRWKSFTTLLAKDLNFTA
jgi:hypothetical protein